MSQWSLYLDCNNIIDATQSNSCNTHTDKQKSNAKIFICHSIRSVPRRPYPNGLPSIYLNFCSSTYLWGISLVWVSLGLRFVRWQFWRAGPWPRLTFRLALLLGTSETFSETTDGDVMFHTLLDFCSGKDLRAKGSMKSRGEGYVI